MTRTEPRASHDDVITEWKPRPHPFGGGYCVARSINGQTDHLLSHIGCAPSIRSFHSRGEAQCEADRLNSELTRAA
jgi:hypothetical protein